MKAFEIYVEEGSDGVARVRVIDRVTQRIMLDRAFVSPEAPELQLTITHHPKGCALEIRQRSLQAVTILQEKLR